MGEGRKVRNGTDGVCAHYLFPADRLLTKMKPGGILLFYLIFRGAKRTDVIVFSYLNKEATKRSLIDGKIGL